MTSQLRVLPRLLAVPAALALSAMTALTPLAATSASASETPPRSHVPPAATAGTIGVRLLDAPVTAGDDPRARVYIVDHLAPGTVIHRRIEVSNTTSSITQVGSTAIYTSDPSNLTTVVPAVTAT
jgi:hypothetical protein